MKIRSRFIPVILLTTILFGFGNNALAGAHDVKQPPVKVTKPKPVLITNVRVWDGEADEAVAGLDVLIKDQLIEAIAMRAFVEIVDRGSLTAAAGP